MHTYIHAHTQTARFLECEALKRIQSAVVERDQDALAGLDTYSPQIANIALCKAIWKFQKIRGPNVDPKQI